MELEGRGVIAGPRVVVGELGRDVARTARGDEPASSAPRPARVLGWQRFVLGVNALCTRCNAILPKGTEAGIGVLDGATPDTTRPIMCLACTEELTRDDR